MIAIPNDRSAIAKVQKYVGLLPQVNVKLPLSWLPLEWRIPDSINAQAIKYARGVETRCRSYRSPAYANVMIARPLGLKKSWEGTVCSFWPETRPKWLRDKTYFRICLYQADWT